MTTATRSITRPLPTVSDRGNDIIVAFALGVVLTLLSYVVGVAAGWITAINPLETFAVFTSYACTYLCVKQRRLNYPIGALSTAAYCLLFIQYGLVASAILNAYLVIALIYGWFRWRADEVTRPVEHIKLSWIPLYIVGTAAFYVGAYLLIILFKGTFGFWDAAILALTILAQFLLDNKKIETWYVWAVLNVIAIGVYFTAGLPLASFQYVFFLLNAFWGLYEWHKSMKAKTLLGVVTPPIYTRTPEGLLDVNGEFAPNGVFRQNADGTWSEAVPLAVRGWRKK